MSKVPSILRAGHVAINVRDATESQRFYGETLGLPLSKAVPFDGFRIQYARLPDGSTVELFDYDRPLVAVAPADERATGLRHLAFMVDDLNAWETRLRQAGVPITLAPTSLPTLGVRVLLFQDPNGVTLELVEPLE